MSTDGKSPSEIVVADEVFPTSLLQSLDRHLSQGLQHPSPVDFADDGNNIDRSVETVTRAAELMAAMAARIDELEALVSTTRAQSKAQIGSLSVELAKTKSDLSDREADLATQHQNIGELKLLLASFEQRLERLNFEKQEALANNSRLMSVISEAFGPIRASLEVPVAGLSRMLETANEG